MCRPLLLSEWQKDNNLLNAQCAKILGISESYYIRLKNGSSQCSFKMAWQIIDKTNKAVDLRGIYEPWLAKHG